jgi:predicted lipid-binding transport protein (Tim44 family)
MLKTHYTKVKETSLRRWINVNDGDATALRRGKRGNDKTDAKAFETLMNDYISTFGFSDDYKAYLKQREITAKVMMDYLQDVRKNKFTYNFVEIERAKLEAMETENTTKIIDIVSELRTKVKINVDLDNLTVYDYEYMVRNLAKNGK